MLHTTIASDEDIRAATVPRKIDGGKWENGAVVLFAGSSDYHGAPVLAARAAYSAIAALRVGTGYAQLYVPKAIIGRVRSLSPNIIVREFGKKNIREGEISIAKLGIDKAEAVAIGMGIGRGKATMMKAASIIDYAVASKKKVVVDADAIYSVGNVRRFDKNVVLTPHLGEFGKIYGKELKARSLEDRIQAAVRMSKKIGCCILLKGHETVVTDGEEIKVIRSESSALATMGTGDVLSGIISGYMACGADSFRAAVAGAYVHSRIGDKLYKKKGTHIIAVDVAEAIPSFLKRFDRKG